MRVALVCSIEGSVPLSKCFVLQDLLKRRDGGREYTGFMLVIIVVTQDVGSRWVAASKVLLAVKYLSRRYPPVLQILLALQHTYSHLTLLQLVLNIT